eukprot:1396075-Amphidinium_carterae.2
MGPCKDLLVPLLTIQYKLLHNQCYATASTPAAFGGASLAPIFKNKGSTVSSPGSADHEGASGLLFVSVPPPSSASSGSAL